VGLVVAFVAIALVPDHPSPLYLDFWERRSSFWRRRRRPCPASRLGRSGSSGSETRSGRRISGSGPTAVYVVNASVERPDGSIWELADFVYHPTFDRLHEGDRVAFVVVPSRPSSHEIGTATHMNLGTMFLIILALGACWWFTRIYRRRALRWFETEKIVETSEGPLPEPGKLA
jgi:hypothetical protein